MLKITLGKLYSLIFKDTKFLVDNNLNRKDKQKFIKFRKQILGHLFDKFF